LVRRRFVEELRRLKAGPDGERVPTLLEVLEAAGEQPLLLDLHEDDVVAATALCRDLAPLGSSQRERLWIASEHGRVIEAVRQLDPMLRTAATKREAWNKLLLGSVGLGRLAARGKVWIVPERHAGLAIVTRRFVADAREAGDSVWVFVVDDASTMRRLRGLGVSGCITTRPAGLLAALEREGREGTAVGWEQHPVLEPAEKAT
jgi:glycerophosphoryl diester phosphodiesterase